MEAVGLASGANVHNDEEDEELQVVARESDGDNKRANSRT